MGNESLVLFQRTLGSKHYEVVQRGRAATRRAAAPPRSLKRQMKGSE